MYYIKKYKTRKFKKTFFLPNILIVVIYTHLKTYKLYIVKSYHCLKSLKQNQIPKRLKKLNKTLQLTKIGAKQLKKRLGPLTSADWYKKYHLNQNCFLFLIPC